MDAINKPVNNEEIVIKRQWMAFIAMFVLFALAGLISVKVFGVIKYSVLGACIPMLYLGTSSIKNRISIIRSRRQKRYSRDKRAVALGAAVLIAAIAEIIIVFTPFLSDILLPF